MMIIMDKLTN